MKKLNSLNDLKESMYEEKLYLYKKIQVMGLFLKSDVYFSFDEREKKMTNKQFCTMVDYYRILSRRLEELEMWGQEYDQ